MLQIVREFASQRRAASGVCWQDEIEHRLPQACRWAGARVWQRSTQAARMAVQSTAMAGAVQHQASRHENYVRGSLHSRPP